MRIVVFGSIVLLAVVHQDYWWWDSVDPLVFGFIPISLAYHAGISLTAAMLWALAVKFCWPSLAEDVERMSDTDGSDGGHA